MEFRHPDRFVAKRLLKGDERAFKELFDSYFPRLYRYALARVGGDRDEANDIVQQTFCKAFERIDSYRGEASLYSWICQICTNTLIDAARRKQRQVQLIPLPGTEITLQTIVESIRAPESAQPESELSRAHLLALIQATLDYLPAHYGDVLEWKYVEELSVKQIAEQLDIGPKAAESLLTRARNAFKEAFATLSESGAALPSRALEV